MKRIITVLLLVFSLIGIAYGQDKGNESSKDNALRGSGRVNASTLGMEFQLDLGSYPGRGINIPVSLSYSSKLWRMDYLGNRPVPGSQYSPCRKHYYPKFAEKSASGWTTSLATPYIEYVGGRNFYNSDGTPVSFGDAECPTSSGGNESYPFHYVRRIIIHMPSGETHEMRPDDTVISFASGGNSDPSGPYQPGNWDAAYYAVDGSNIRYYQNDEYNVYRLRMPDGSYYDFDPAPTATDDRKAVKFTDRNGNFTTYHGPASGYPNGYWTDTLGRVLAVPLNPEAPPAATPANSPQEISLPGMTGTYKLHWKLLKGTTEAESAISDFDLALRYLGETYQCTSPSGFPTYCTHGEAVLFTGDENTRIVSNTVFNPVLLKEIELPTGTSYRFAYDLYGRIEKIEYPTGAVETFVYSVVPTLSVLDPTDAVGGITNFGVTSRKVFENAGDTTPYEWTYSASYVTQQAGYKVVITNPDGTRAERELHRGYDAEPQMGLYGYDNGLAGMAYEERGYDSANGLLSKKVTSWTATTLFTSNGGNPQAAHWHPRVEQVQSFAYDTSGNGVSATSQIEYEDAANLNLRSTPVLPKKTIEYPFVVAGDPLPAHYRTSESTYFIYDANIPQGWRDIYKDRNMVGLVNAVVVKDAAGTVVSRSEMKYDETGYSPELGRGNPTSSRVWDSTKGPHTDPSAYIQTRARFDVYGNQYESIDALGNVTTTAFDSTHHAYPVQVTGTVPDPSGQQGSSTAFTSFSTFDPVTGLPLTTIDANNLETRIEYDPATLRPLRVKKYYQNNQVGGTVETVYHDEQNNYWVKNRAQVDAGNWAESITYFDGLGRAYKSEEVNSNGNVYTEKEFDPDGRVLRVSNPYRAGEARKWTTNVYDQASRVIEVILQDGSSVKTGYGVSTSGVIGITKTITDQAGKTRRGISDALGRMVRVIEDVSIPGIHTGQDLATDYAFDTLGNLRKTIQGEQSRYFTFDSLGRLLYSKQPEQNANTAFSHTDPVTNNSQWSVKYEY